MNSKAKIAAGDLDRRLREAAEARDARALEALAAEDLPKPLRKELRRVAHRLRSSGIAMELPPMAAGQAMSGAPNAEPYCRAYLSAVGGSGDRLLWLITDSEQGGRQVTSVCFDDERGLTDITSFTSTRKNARRFEKDLPTHLPVPVAPIEASLARALLLEAEGRTRRAEQALPEGCGALYSQLSRLPGAATLDPHPARALAGEPDRRELLEVLRTSAELLERPLLATWVPSQGQARELIGRIEAVESSTVIVSKEQRIEQLDRIFEQAAQGQLEGEGRARWARRFYDTAWVLSQKGQEDVARHLARLARASEELTDEVPAFLPALLRYHFDDYLRRKFDSPGASGKQARAQGGESASRTGKIIVPP